MDFAREEVRLDAKFLSSLFQSLALLDLVF